MKKKRTTATCRKKRDEERILQYVDRNVDSIVNAVSALNTNGEGEDKNVLTSTKIASPPPIFRVSSNDDNTSTTNTIPPSMTNGHPIRLSYGDCVQIVSTHEDWAKLARGHGMVHCDSETELVQGAYVHIL